MDRLSRLLRAAVAVLILAGLLACRPAVLVEKEAQFLYTASNPLYAVDFQGADILHLTVSGTFADQDLFLVKANGSPFQVSAPGSGGLWAVSGAPSRSVGPGGTVVARDRATAPAGSAADRPVVLKDHPAASQFNSNPPPFRPRQDGVMAKSLSGPRLTVSYGTDSPPASPREFWVTDAGGAWIQVSATLEYHGDFCYVWVAQDSLGAGSTQITSAEARSIGEAFNGTGPAYDDGIYRLVSNLFGFEHGGGVGGDGGVDEDQHVSILIYDIDYDYGDPGAKIVGYFWAKDHYTQAQLDSVYGAGVLQSNEAEMFYLDAEFVKNHFQIAVSTLAHEYQHMIHFNRKFLENGVASETWFDEMLSMLAEDLLQDHLGIDNADSPKARGLEFNSYYFESGVTDWLSTNVLASYASAYVFGAFLARNYGGAALVRSIMANPYSGRQSITAALADQANPEDFEAVFRAYAPALIYSQPPPAGVKIIDTSDSRDYDGITYTLSGFDLYDYANAVSGYGPVVFYAWYSLPLRPYGHSIHSDDPWLGLDGEQSLTISLRAPSASVAYYLMVR